MYVKLSNGQPVQFPYNLGNLKRDNPDTSFPDPIPNDTLEQYDVYPVTATPAPAFDSKTQGVIQGVEQVNGVWTQTWSVQRIDEQRASDNIRAERNRLLADCDWTQVKDAPVDSTVWAVYRQSLRDVTAQPGFPWDVVWPNSPA